MTVQAPHWPRSHPIFDPVSLRSSRRNCSSVVLFGTCLRYGVPFTFISTSVRRGSGSMASGSWASAVSGISVDERAPVASAPPLRNARRETECLDVSRWSSAIIGHPPMVAPSVDQLRDVGRVLSDPPGPPGPKDPAYVMKPVPCTLNTQKPYLIPNCMMRGSPVCVVIRPNVPASRLVAGLPQLKLLRRLNTSTRSSSVRWVAMETSRDSARLTVQNPGPSILKLR